MEEAYEPRIFLSHKDVELDSLDRKIIAALSKDARRPLAELSRELGVSDVTIASRIRQLQNSKTILGFTVVLDHERLGLPISAFIALRIKPGTSDIVGERLAKMDWIVAIYEIHGFCDLLLRVRASGLRQLRDYVVKQVSKDPNIISKDVIAILRIGKEEGRNYYSAGNQSDDFVTESLLSQ